MQKQIASKQKISAFGGDLHKNALNTVALQDKSK